MQSAFIVREKETSVLVARHKRKGVLNRE